MVGDVRVVVEPPGGTTDGYKQGCYGRICPGEGRSCQQTPATGRPGFPAGSPARGAPSPR